MPVPVALLILDRVAAPLIRIFAGGGRGADIVSASSGVGHVLADRFAARKVNRELDDVADTIAMRLGKMIETEFRQLAPGDRTAAILAVGNIVQVADLDATKIVRSNLDPVKLREELLHGFGDVRAQLESSHAEGLFDVLLAEVCNYVVEIATGLPDFSLESMAALLQRGESISDRIDQILERLPSSRASTPDHTSAQFYRSQYLRNVARLYDWVSILGADLEEITHRYSLSSAYVSATSISAGHGGRPSEVEDLLSTLERRVLVVGEAGYGKSTLAHWAAVNAARQEFPPSLAEWNELTPFVVQLRSFRDVPMPGPEDFVGEAGKPLSSYKPKTWCADILRKGKGLVLIDGLDEVPEEKRTDVLTWLTATINTFPESWFILTSRPAAVRKDVRALFNSSELWLLPMEPGQIETFIGYWHKAVAENLDAEESVDLFDLRDELIPTVLTTASLRNLAGTPLLCAVICALNVARRGKLPSRRVALYEQAISMLVSRRDEERGFPPPRLAKEEVEVILEELARWLTLNGLSEAPMESTKDCIARTMRSMPHVNLDAQNVLDHLLLRSGLLREPSKGIVDFIHRTFQEFLAARSLLKDDDVPLLISRADETDWHEVIVLACGQASKVEADRLIKGLLERITESDGEGRARLEILTVSCFSAAVQVELAFAEQVRELWQTLVPPKTPRSMTLLGACGPAAIPLIVESIGTDLSREELLYSIRALARIGGPEGLAALAHLSPALHIRVVDELFTAWAYFDPLTYARQVLERLQISRPVTAEIRETTLVALTARLPSKIRVRARLRQLPRDIARGTARIHTLVVTDTASPLDPLLRIEGLANIHLKRLDDFDLTDSSGTSSATNLVAEFFPGTGLLNAESLWHFPALENLTLAGWVIIRGWSECPTLADLRLLRLEDASSLDDEDRWPDLPGLEILDVRSFQGWDLDCFAQYDGLVELVMRDAPMLSDLSALREMVNLKRLDLRGCSQIRDLSDLNELPLEEILVDNVAIRPPLDDRRFAMRTLLPEDFFAPGSSWPDDEEMHAEEIAAFLLGKQGEPDSDDERWAQAGYVIEDHPRNIGRT